MYRPVLVSAPATMPVSLDEVKAQLDIFYTDKDNLIASLIAAAVSHLDGWTGILGWCLVAQTWRQDFDEFNRCLRLPLFPVISIDSVKYDDAEGEEQTVDPNDYALLTDDLGAYVRFVDSYGYAALNQQRPALRVSYIAGHADIPAVEADPEADPPVAASPAQSTVPPVIRQIMFLLIRHWFDNPSAVNVGAPVFAMPFAADALIASVRRIRV